MQYIKESSPHLSQESQHSIFEKVFAQPQYLSQEIHSSEPYLLTKSLISLSILETWLVLCMQISKRDNLILFSKRNIIREECGNMGIESPFWR